MIISSWNVNSIRARIENIKEYIKKFSPDVLMMQEIKTPNETYPFDDLKKLILSSFNKGAKKDDYKFMIRDRHNKLFQDVVKNLVSAQKGLKENLSLDLVAEDLRLARSCIDELVGEKFSDSLLGDIFSSYCIGK